MADKNTTTTKVPFKRNQVKLAVNAILAYVNTENDSSIKKKTELFSSKNNFWLMVALRKIPRTEVKPRKIPLPHPLHPREVCFISSQPGKLMKKMFEEKGITNIQKVISLTKLRKEYKTFELKRQLISTYDVFLCEEKIFHFVTKSLGKNCYKQKKEPIAVRMDNVDLKSEIDKCLSSTRLRVGRGASSSIVIGDIDEHSSKELYENVVHAMRVAGNKIPGQWDNIKAMFVKTSNSVALPVYQASPLVTNELTEVEKHGAEKPKRKRKRKKTPTLKDVNIEETVNDIIPTQAVDDDDTKSPSDVIDESDVESIVEEQEEDEEEDVPKKKKKNKNSKKVSIPSKKKGPRKIKSK